jgi:hypothetical protein
LKTDCMSESVGLPVLAYSIRGTHDEAVSQAMETNGITFPSNVLYFWKGTAVLGSFSTFVSFSPG